LRNKFKPEGKYTSLKRIKGVGGVIVNLCVCYTAEFLQYCLLW
jgi:hypothetical protein